MAKRRKGKKQSNFVIILRTFIILFVLIIAFVAFRYYRRQAIQSEQIRQEQLAREEARQKIIRQHKAFIKEIGPIAKEVDREFELLPSITIAQACLESDYGQSSLSQKYNNLFGVKGTNPNTSAVLTTKEYVKGKWIVVKARFQIYDSYEASIRAHARLFQKGTTWNKQQYKHVLTAKDYRKQAHALVQDGYATDPNYADKLIKLIEQYHLDRFDK
ncbi:MULTISPECIES: glycoside hydrolase family 73 protein [Lactobacillus]|uniref:Glycoside hydrolase family 73 protein n=1 Tax=Lactobacillus panisapium TaxID=2012495 RepID=A0ABX8W6Y9_9LACO|nr:MULTISPECIES: glycoside hydrolase family 73 protein [Lactobacillus]MCO6531239.1 glycoside hydrolase family 73 protein [Lactobacillus sp.]MCO6535084.1 glycoside hydrolase family 73 protein [Lactobacillus sp.]MCT6853037.1 glycoside hydrolase family 73 protein [Lactobacillus panisapium]MCX8722171.1 glycoside hydrolase family 73 protein [Lactobacillus sp. B4010]MCX8722433.1 glycoside hydrolase family 73 protein [Lactobacillus sp. B4005]